MQPIIWRSLAFTFAAAAGLALAPLATHAATVSGDFTTDNDGAPPPLTADGTGYFSYGNKLTPSSGYALFTQSGSYFGEPSNSGIFAHSNGNYQAVIKNNSSATPFSNTMTIPAGGVGLHPDNGGSIYSAIRFNVVEPGPYDLSGVFSSADTLGATTDVYVVVNEVAAPIAPNAVTAQTSVPFDFTTAPLAAGDTIDFVVGNGGNGYGNDATALSATIELVPEPASLALLGLGALAMLRRRRI